MSEYEQILKAAKKQNIHLENKKILIPKRENYYLVNDEGCFGRVFEDKGIVVLYQETEEPYSETAYKNEPYIYTLDEKFKTYLSNGTMLYLVEFYIIS